MYKYAITIQKHVTKVARAIILNCGCSLISLKVMPYFHEMPIVSINTRTSSKAETLQHSSTIKKSTPYSLSAVFSVLSSKVCVSSPVSSPGSFCSVPSLAKASGCWLWPWFAMGLRTPPNKKDSPPATSELSCEDFPGFPLLPALVPS